MAAAADFIDRSWGALGYQVKQQLYEARGLRFANLEVELTGTDRPKEIIIIGAHYDTHRKSPGANDNGSAITALLELAHAYAGKTCPYTLRLVAFTNKERPFTRTNEMGSRAAVPRTQGKDQGNDLS